MPTATTRHDSHLAFVEVLPDKDCVALKPSHPRSCQHQTVDGLIYYIIGLVYQLLRRGRRHGLGSLLHAPVDDPSDRHLS